MKTGKSMQELSESDGLKTFFDRRLIKALSHPVRAHIFAVFSERIASAREIGEELGADVSSFYHHIEILEELDCVERVYSRQRRGAREHFFRAKRMVFFDNSAWEQLPFLVRTDLTSSFVQGLFDETAAALDAGTIDGREDEHVSWTPARLDAQGLTEATKVLNQALCKVLRICDGSARRLAETGEGGLPAVVGILAFETPGQAFGPSGKALPPA